MTQDLHNFEIEQLVLGAIIMERQALQQVEGIVSKETFTDQRHVAIFDAISALAKGDKPIDVITVTAELRRQDKLQTAGGMVYISELSAIVNSTSHLGYHVRLLYDLQLKRAALELGKRLMEDASDPTADIVSTLASAEDKLLGLSTESMSDGKHISEILPEVIDDMNEASQNDRGITGISTGFPSIDQLTNGFNPPDLMILAARPGMGKTALLLEFFRNVSVDHQIPSLIFSFEMSEKQLVNRFLVLQSQVPNECVKHGRLTDIDRQRIETATAQLEQAPIYVVDDSSLTVYTLRAKARKYVRDKGVKIIGIDYLQLMNGADNRGRNGSREQEISAISRGLKQLAKELNVPVIALSQLNRSVEERPDKRPRLSDLRESGAIEQDADQVVFVHRPEYYGKTEDRNNADLRGKAEYIVAKQRNGKVDNVWIRFDGATMRFYPDDGGFVQSTVGNSDLPF